MDCARFAIRDLMKDGFDGLSDSCKVGVGRLSVNPLEVVKEMGEFATIFSGVIVFRRRCAHRLEGLEPPSSKS